MCASCHPQKHPSFSSSTNSSSSSTSSFPCTSYMFPLSPPLPSSLLFLFLCLFSSVFNIIFHSSASLYSCSLFISSHQIIRNLFSSSISSSCIIQSLAFRQVTYIYYSPYTHMHIHTLFYSSLPLSLYRFISLSFPPFSLPPCRLCPILLFAFSFLTFPVTPISTFPFLSNTYYSVFFLCFPLLFFVRCL